MPEHRDVGGASAPDVDDIDHLPDWYDKRFDPYVIAVGRIANIWAQLEFNINQAIWELCNVETGAGACVTSQIGSIG